ncbi:MAG: helix-turn-helix domain-containing protein [Deltaproteobacteria bacterium]|nr:MAG: helix-turn-helix domain-containing protein [Deltaproteobacteria bacterium]
MERASTYYEERGGLGFQAVAGFRTVYRGFCGQVATLLTVREVAAYLRVSTKTVYGLCARGELRHIRVLNAIRIAPSGP